MKFLLVLMLLFQTAGCSEKKNSADVKSQKEHTNDTTIAVKNIEKNCYKNINTNIYDYILCVDWNLSQNDIKNIILAGQKNNSPETRYMLTPVIPSWITADVVVDEKAYKIEINPFSFYYLTDSQGNRELYTFSSVNKKKVETLFIRELSEEDDGFYNKKIADAKQKLNNQKLDYSAWKGVLKFDNNNYEQLYKDYTIEIQNEGIFFHEGELPSCKIFCKPLLVKDALYLYFDGEKTNCYTYDTALIDQLQDGDLIFKVYKEAGQKYIQSPIINYWDDENKVFDKNTKIIIN